MIKDEDHALETYKGLIQLSLTAIRSLVLLNGGAIIAILAYLGDRSENAPDLSWPILIFVIGLVAAGAVSLLAYLTQLSLYNETNNRQPRLRHGWPLTTAVVLAFVSLAAFACGAVLAACRL